MQLLANRAETLLYGAPLCPAGHLPREGGDWPSSTGSRISNFGDLRRPTRSRISPLAGEMSGRTEGGAKDREFSRSRPTPLTSFANPLQPH